MSRYWFSILSFLKYFIRYLRIFHRIERYIMKGRIYIIFIILKLIQIYACKISNILVWLFVRNIYSSTSNLSNDIWQTRQKYRNEMEFFSNILRVFVIYWLQIDVIIKTLQHRGLQVIKKNKTLKNWNWFRE